MKDFVAAEALAGAAAVGVLAAKYLVVRLPVVIPIHCNLIGSNQFHSHGAPGGVPLNECVAVASKQAIGKDRFPKHKRRNVLVRFDVKQLR